MTALRGNLGELVAQVWRRAEQHALGIEASAERNAEEILDKASERAEATRATIREEGRRTAEEACRQCLAVADLERRRRRLEAREARLDRVWDAARARLDELADGGIDPGTLARLARHAARELGADEVVVRLDEASASGVDENDVAGWAEGDGPALRLGPDSPPRRHGVVAQTGRSSIDATFEGRLDQARERLRSEIDALLTDATRSDAQPADALPTDELPTPDGDDDA